MAVTYQARQIETTKKWHYTFGSDEEKWIRPYGYCADHEGHDTAKEAEECALKYRLDKHLSFHRSNDTQKLCQVCGEWTTDWAEVGGALTDVFNICEKHGTRENVEKLMKGELDGDGL